MPSLTVLRFRIGDAFPADDPVARFITGLAMISNDWLRSMDDMFALGDTEEATGRRVSLFRRQAALIHEAATFITDARRMFPEVEAFVGQLEAPAQDACARVTDSVDRTSAQYLGDWLEDHRNVTHHYPKMHPEAARNGQEEMANALARAADIQSSIESGTKFGHARFRFADEVGVQLLPKLDDTDWVVQLRETAMALAEFAQRAAQAYLESRPAGTFVAVAEPRHAVLDIVETADEPALVEQGLAGQRAIITQIRLSDDGKYTYGVGGFDDDSDVGGLYPEDWLIATGEKASAEIFELPGPFRAREVVVIGDDYDEPEAAGQTAVLTDSFSKDADTDEVYLAVWIEELGRVFTVHPSQLTATGERRPPEARGRVASSTAVSTEGDVRGTSSYVIVDEIDYYL